VNPIRLYAIGPPGSFKTRLAYTFPDVLFLDFDYGLSGLLAEGKEVTFVRPATWQECLLIKMQLCRNEEMEVNGKRLKPGTVVIDTITEMYPICGDAILSIDPKKKMNIKIGEGILTDSGHREVMDMSDFGLALTRVMTYVRDLVRDFHGHVVVNAHEELFEQAAGTVKLKQVGGGAALPGKLRARLPSLFDIYCRMLPRTSVDPVRMQSAADDQFPLKDRFGKLPAFLENPSYEKIVAHLQGG